jgi:acetyl esterase/lipase
VAQQQAVADGPLPAFVLALYPGTDTERTSRSREMFGTGFGLTLDYIAELERLYLPDGVPSDDMPSCGPTTCRDAARAGGEQADGAGRRSIGPRAHPHPPGIPSGVGVIAARPGTGACASTSSPDRALPSPGRGWISLVTRRSARSARS